METPEEFLESFDPQIKEVGYDNYLYTPQQVIDRLKAYRKELVKESDSLPCVIALLDSLGDFNNEYSLEYHKSDAKWWIIHKKVGSGFTLEQWLTKRSF